MYDTFQTLQHSGIYFQSRHNRAIGRAEFYVASPTNGHGQTFHTLRAAKLACTRIRKAITRGLLVEYPHLMTGGRRA